MVGVGRRGPNDSGVTRITVYRSVQGISLRVIALFKFHFVEMQDLALANERVYLETDVKEIFTTHLSASL